MRTGELGFWWRSLGGEVRRREPLAGAGEADVAIVGGGYTGLWTAYYLKRARPDLEVVVLEREVVGFGASGRNGGWVSGFFSGPPRAYARGAAPGAYLALQRAMFDTVGEIARVIAEHRIDADLLCGGHIEVALGNAQLERMRAAIADLRSLGLTEEDLRELDRDELTERLRVAGARGGSFSPHVARVHPAKLVAGLAAAVEELGVRIHEGTPVTEIRPARRSRRSGPCARAGWCGRRRGTRRLCGACDGRWHR